MTTIIVVVVVVVVVVDGKNRKLLPYIAVNSQCRWQRARAEPVGYCKNADSSPNQQCQCFSHACYSSLYKVLLNIGTLSTLQE